MRRRLSLGTLAQSGAYATKRGHFGIAVRCKIPGQKLQKIAQESELRRLPEDHAAEEFLYLKICPIEDMGMRVDRERCIGVRGIRIVWTDRADRVGAKKVRKQTATAGRQRAGNGA